MLDVPGKIVVLFLFCFVYATLVQGLVYCRKTLALFPISSHPACSGNAHAIVALHANLFSMFWASKSFKSGPSSLSCFYIDDVSHFCLVVNNLF